MVRDLLADRVCPSGYAPSYVDINGTTYVTCVTDNSVDNSLALKLGLGLGIGLGVGIIVFGCINNNHDELIITSDIFIKNSKQEQHF